MQVLGESEIYLQNKIISFSGIIEWGDVIISPAQTLK
jgi:hypothetical protein